MPCWIRLVIRVCCCCCVRCVHKKCSLATATNHLQLIIISRTCSGSGLALWSNTSSRQRPPRPLFPVDDQLQIWRLCCLDDRTQSSASLRRLLSCHPPVVKHTWQFSAVRKQFKLNQSLLFVLFRFLAEAKARKGLKGTSLVLLYEQLVVFKHPLNTRAREDFFSYGEKLPVKRLWSALFQLNSDICSCFFAFQISWRLCHSFVILSTTEKNTFDRRVCVGLVCRKKNFFAFSRNWWFFFLQLFSSASTCRPKIRRLFFIMLDLSHFLFLSLSLSLSLSQLCKPLTTLAPSLCKNVI